MTAPTGDIVRQRVSIAKLAAVCQCDTVRDLSSSPAMRQIEPPDHSETGCGGVPPPQENSRSEEGIGGRRRFVTADLCASRLAKWIRNPRSPAQTAEQTTTLSPRGRAHLRQLALGHLPPAARADCRVSQALRTSPTS